MNNNYTSRATRLGKWSAETRLSLKIVYCAYFGAVGILSVLLPTYFKQQALNACELGVIFAAKHAVSCAALPFWGRIAQHTKRRHKTLMISFLLCLCVYTVTLSLPKSSPFGCLKTNSTHLFVRQHAYVLHDFDQTENNIQLNSVNKDSKNAAERVSKSENSLQNFTVFTLLPVESIQHQVKSDSNNQNLSVTTEKYVFTSNSVGISTTTRKINRVNNNKPYVTRSNAKPRSTTTKSTSYFGEYVAFYVDDSQHMTSPIALHDVIEDGGDQSEMSSYATLVIAIHSDVIYTSFSAHSTFIILLLLTILGEFLSASFLPYIDSFAVTSTAGNLESYCLLRQWGCVGWGVSVFVTSALLDALPFFKSNPCGYDKPLDRNYTVIFVCAIVELFVAVAMVTKCQPPIAGSRSLSRLRLAAAAVAITTDQQRHVSVISAPSTLAEENERLAAAEAYASFLEGNPVGKVPQMSDGGNNVSGMMLDDGTSSTWQPLGQGQGDEVYQNEMKLQATLTFMPVGGVEQWGGMIDGWAVLGAMLTTHPQLAALVMTWYVSFASSVTSVFIAWHEHSLQATPIVLGALGIASSLAELAAHRAAKITATLGYRRLLYISLIVIIVRSFYISWTQQPWTLLPVEFICVFTLSALMAAVGVVIRRELPITHWVTGHVLLYFIRIGLGNGIGVLAGGIFVYYFGAKDAFRGYGIATCIIFVTYFAFDFIVLNKRRSQSTSNPRRQTVQS